MKTKEEIEKKLEYETKVVKNYKGCTPGTDGYERLQIAENIVSVLQWVLKEK